MCFSSPEFGIEGNLLARSRDGIQLRAQCGMLLEGCRPKHIIIVMPATWIYRTLPMEKQLFGRE